MAEKNIKKRTVYLGEEADDAIVELANDTDDSVVGTYHHLIKLGLSVETISRAGAEVYAEINGKKILIAPSGGTLKRLPDIKGLDY